MKQLPGWGNPASRTSRRRKLYGIQFQVNVPSRDLRHLRRRPEVHLPVKSLMTDRRHHRGDRDVRRGRRWHFRVLRRSERPVVGRAAARLADDQPIVLDEGSGPAPAAAPQPAAPVAVTAETVAFRAHDAKTGNVYFDCFAAMWNDIHNPANGYFSPEGVPDHAVEQTLTGCAGARRRPTTPCRRRTATGCGSRRPTASRPAIGKLSRPRLEEHGAVHHPDAGRSALRTCRTRIASPRRTRPRATRRPLILRS